MSLPWKPWGIWKIESAAVMPVWCILFQFFHFIAISGSTQRAVCVRIPLSWQDNDLARKLFHIFTATRTEISIWHFSYHNEHNFLSLISSHENDMEESLIQHQWVETEKIKTERLNGACPDDTKCWEFSSCNFLLLCFSRKFFSSSPSPRPSLCGKSLLRCLRMTNKKFKEF